MIEVCTVMQIDNGFLLRFYGSENHSGDPRVDNYIYCKDHKEIAEMLVSKRVAEKLLETEKLREAEKPPRAEPVQQEIRFQDQPF